MSTLWIWAQRQDKKGPNWEQVRHGQPLAVVYVGETLSLGAVSRIMYIYIYNYIYILKRNPSEVPWNACWCRWAMVDMGRANCAVQKGKRDEYDEPIIDLMYWWNAYWCLILWKQFGAQLVHGTLWNGAEAVFMNNFPQYSIQIDARMEAPCSDLRCNLKSLYKVSCVRMPICHAWLFRG